MKVREWEKVSDDYYTEILSPIKNSQENPLMKDLDVLGGKNKKIIDLGCGLGEIEKDLSKQFGEVVGIDFSKKMVESAKKRNKSLNNVEFYVKDMTNLQSFDNKFDVAIAINSILSGNLNEINKIFKEIHKILRKDGKFIAILPSMEVFIYQSLIIADKESKKNKNQEKIRRKIRELIMKQEHDFLLGITNFEGKQKHYYQFEILWRLKKAGFKSIRIKRVFYSWEEFEEAGQGYFPGEDPPWDWYVICEK
ncbi:demethylmenaquinone methyltransferase [archaeon BMS3Abin17]|nr:demethylmenaquinone methyltransferase [archaeon BMS3Abin17]HDZ61203.1 class I SAM-dependent methyltransferase [Candidatus Pacearchaeota archaeon]